MTQHPWIAIALVLAVLLGLMGLLRVYGRLRHPHPEIPRKLLHVGMGVVTLSFPWVFSATWPVWVVATISVLLLTATKVANPLQRLLGGVVDGVDRSSLGDLYFPISVALIFQLADRQPLLYCIPILLLTLADAVAALIGCFYGHIHYTVVGGRKSAEGSIAFFMVAFLSTHVPLLLFSSSGRAASLLLALTVGLLVMLIEAVAWNGLDNVLVPLGGFLLLRGYLAMDVPTLTLLLVGTVGWVAFVFLLRRRSTLDDGALLSAALVGYLTWTLGGWAWVLPPLTLYLGYTVLWPRRTLLCERPHDVHAVAAVCVPGLLWLALARSYGQWEFFYPYTVFFAAQLSFIGVVYYREVHLRTIDLPRALICATKSCALLFVLFLCLHGLSAARLIQAACAFAVVLIATIVFNLIIPRPEHYSIERFPWLWQAALGGIASVLCLFPLYLLKG